MYLYVSVFSIPCVYKRKMMALLFIQKFVYNCDSCIRFSKLLYHKYKKQQENILKKREKKTSSSCNYVVSVHATHSKTNEIWMKVTDARNGNR